MPHPTHRPLTLLAVALAACTDASAPLVPGVAAPSPALMTSVATADSLARLVAVAMGEPATRAAVFGALQTSPWNEHKRVLQELSLLSAPAAVAHVSAALGRSAADVARLTRQVPRLDFYVLHEDDRARWKGTPDIRVAAAMTEDQSSVTAFDTRGQGVAVPRGATRLPFVLLILHPEEPKLRRSPDTSTLGAAAAGGPAPGIYINHFNIQSGDGWFGNLEMLFVSKAIVPPILAWVGDYSQFPTFMASCELGAWARNDVVEDRGYNGLFPLAPAPGTAPLACDGQPAIHAIQIVEQDGGLTGADDEFGWRFYVPGTYPQGATFGTTSAAVASFFENTWTATRSAYLRVQVVN